MLYTDDQRTMLKHTSAALALAGMGHKGDATPVIDTLMKAVYQGKKDFSVIKKLTDGLEKLKNEEYEEKR